MKRALVLVALLAMVGFTATAQLSGSWKTTIGIDPMPATFPGYITALGSTLTVDYDLSGWAFGAVSVFDIAGFADQKFTAAGDLGAFTFSTSLQFDPAKITEKVYTHMTSALYALQSSSEVCPVTWTVGTVVPAFTKWDVTAGLSIAGVDIEVYVLQYFGNYNVKLTGYLWDTDAGPAAVADAWSCTTKNNGMGVRFKLAGSFGDVSVTSYTYFNMTEANSLTTFCPTLGKRGVFSLDPDCDLATFKEQFLLIEGFTFGCASIDIGLTIDCEGFDNIQFLVTDVSIGGWMTFDFEITFTTASKALDLCLNLDALEVDCFTIELGFGNSGYVTSTGGPLEIDKIVIHGFGLSYSWNGITFTSYTELDVYSMLISAGLQGVYGTGYAVWSYVDGDAAMGFVVPYAGYGEGAAPVCDGAEGATTGHYEIADNVWEVKCVPNERYKIWELFKIDVDADACCGGLFDLTVTNYFGDHQVLDWVGYGLILAGETTATGLETFGPYTGTMPAAYHDVTSTKTYDRVSFDYAYKLGTTTSLFDWVKTAADLSIGVGENATLTLGFDITVFGWEALEFGFLWEF